MDKETLIKHHFWIVLGLAVLLVPVVAILVFTGVAEATSARAKVVEDKKKAQAAAKPKGTDFLTKLDEQKKILDGRKFEVWQQVYAAQKGLIQFPPQLDRLTKLYESNKIYYGDPIDDADRNTFKKAEVYQVEYEALAELIKPTILGAGDAPSQPGPAAGSTGWQTAFRVVRWTTKFPTSEDVWLALEDLCIQRELMVCVHDVNQLLARFEEVTDAAAVAEAKKALDEANPTPEDKTPETYQRFVSPYWQLDVATRKAALSQGSQYAIRGLLKNISHRRQHVARIEFMASLNDPKDGAAKKVVIAAEHEYLAVGESVAIKPTLVNVSAAKPQIFTVEQKLDSRYVPVKRVERIVLGKHSHRTADTALILGRISDEAKKKEAEGGQPVAVVDPNAPPAAAAAAPVGDMTASNIDRARYATWTEEVRRMPIGVLLIVDQAHVQDILRAFANSRLRFQATQVHLARYHGAVGAAASPIAPPPVPGVLPNVGASAYAAPTAETSSNLVEVSVYGLISIYEQYPSREMMAAKAAEAAAAAPPADAPPAAPTTPPATAPAIPSTTPPTSPPAAPDTPAAPKAG